MPSYTYELPDPARLLSQAKRNVTGLGEGWDEIAERLLQGHVEYQPLRNNPMRSGYAFVYQKAKLNLILYFPEEDFNRLHEFLDAEKLQLLRGAFQTAIPTRSGYDLHEFKIKGILESPA